MTKAPRLTHITFQWQECRQPPALDVFVSCNPRDWEAKGRIIFKVRCSETVTCPNCTELCRLNSYPRSSCATSWTSLWLALCRAIAAGSPRTSRSYCAQSTTQWSLRYSKRGTSLLKRCMHGANTSQPRLQQGETLSARVLIGDAPTYAGPALSLCWNVPAFQAALSLVHTALVPLSVLSALCSSPLFRPQRLFL